MPFVIQEEVTKETADKLVLPYDEHYLCIDPKDEHAKAKTVGEIVIYLRPLRGRDERRISDLMVEMSRKSKAISMRTGRVSQEKCVRSVIAMEGITLPDGTVVEKLTHDVYDRLDSWITDSILRRVNDLNAIQEDEEGE